MNWYYVLFRSLQILLFVLLILIPFGYCLFKGQFKKGFWFTWAIWSIAIFVFGIFNPALARLVEKATGEPPDVGCGGFILGFVYGWLPGLIFASVGKFLHNIFLNFLRKIKN